MHRSIRSVLSAVTLGLLSVALVGPALPARAEAPVAVVASADQLKSDAVAALKRGEFDRTSDLLKRAAANSADPTLGQMASWVSSFSEQYGKVLADRKVEFDRAVAQAGLLREHDKADYALDAAGRAYLLATDRRAFANEAWVVDLTKDRIAAAAEYEKAGSWDMALRVYQDLSTMEPANPYWKAKAKVAGRYLVNQGLFVPDLSKARLKRIIKEDAEVDALLRGAKLLSEEAMARSTTQPAEDETDEARVDWHEVLKGIDYDMIPGAIHDTVDNWYRDISYVTLAKGSLMGLRVLATTPGLDATFPTLGDKTKRDAFVKGLDAELIALAGGKLSFSDSKELLGRVRDLNTSTVALPECVVASQYMDGALGELDQFSSMIWPYDLEEFRSSTEGAFTGVGIQIELDPKTSYLKVVSPIEDSPSYRAGIKAGSLITHINGESVKKFLLNQAVKRIKGPTGTRVTLTIQSPDGVTKDYILRRDVIKVASIKGWKRVNGGGWDWMIDPVQRVGYLRLSQFTKTSGDELDDALKQLQAQGARGVIMDLRGDPGGLLTTAIEVADKFIPTGTIVSTRADRETPQSPSETQADPDTKKVSVPLIVLVNQMSASASEIVSGALKDHHRAIVVGERSYGKGSVQMLFRVAGRNAMLKLTTHHYYLPSGRCLHREETSTEWGVDPDYAIELTPSQNRAIYNARQEMDVLHYGADDETAANAGAAKAPTTSPAKKPVNLLEADPQLAAAIMLMRLQVAGVKL